MTQTINFLIHGQPGVGKSTFAVLGHKSFVIADTERSTAHITSLGDRRVEVKSIDDLRALLIRAKSGAFKTLIVDTVDELVANQLKNEIRQKGFARNEGQLTLEGFGVMKDKLFALVREFRDANVNILFVCHSDNENVPEEGRMWRPTLPSNWAKELVEKMDGVGYLTFAKTDKGETVRRMYLRPTGTFMAKARGDVDIEKGEVIDILPTFMDNPTFGKVLDLYAAHYRP